MQKTIQYMNKIGTREKCIVVSSALRIVQNLATASSCFVCRRRWDELETLRKQVELAVSKLMAL